MPDPVLSEAIAKKWRATLSNDLQRERFDKLVASFEAAGPEDQWRTGRVAAEMATSGGPMSPTHAAYLNYTLDMLRQPERDAFRPLATD
jgi:hypothetical protein